MFSSKFLLNSSYPSFTVYYEIQMLVFVTFVRDSKINVYCCSVIKCNHSVNDTTLS